MPRKRDASVCRHCRGALPANATFCPWCGERQVAEKRELKVPKPRQLPSGSWFARVTVEGERVPVTAPTEEEYYAMARAVKAGLLEHKKAPKALPLEAAIDKYIDSRRGSVSPATIRGYVRYKKLYFQDLMKTNVFELTADMLQIQIQKMLKLPGKGGKPLSPKTVRNEVGFLASVLKYNAVPLDLAGLSLPKKQASPYAILTREEQGRLLRAIAGDPAELPILLALWLGMRRSEVMALRREDFDFRHSRVHISRAIVQDEDAHWVEKGTKTTESARTVDVPAYILEKVRACPPGPICGGHHPGWPVKRLHAICEREGLPAVRFHDLRHINASVGLQLGVPDKYMMERNGWSSKETMVYRYEHTFSAEKAATDAAINAYFDGLLKPPAHATVNGKNGNENGNETDKPANTSRDSA